MFFDRGSVADFLFLTHWVVDSVDLVLAVFLVTAVFQTTLVVLDGLIFPAIPLYSLVCIPEDHVRWHVVLGTERLVPSA